MSEISRDTGRDYFDLKSAGENLKQTMTCLNRCNICTLKIPCKHYASVEEYQDKINSKPVAPKELGKPPAPNRAKNRQYESEASKPLPHFASKSSTSTNIDDKSDSATYAEPLPPMPH
jgi:hypothetical protein